MSVIMEAVKKLGGIVENNAPAILTGLAVTGTLSTAIFAARGAVKATRELDGYYETYPDEHQKTLNESIRVVWKHYIPAAGMGVATIAAIIGAQAINTRRQAALISMYTLTDTAFKEYREKALEVVGKNAEQKVRDGIAKDRVDSDPVTGRDVIITGKGDVLCYETLTGRYFTSDMESLRKAENNINAHIIKQDYASQNDFYREIGLDRTELGDDVGWNTSKMLDLDFTAVVSSDGRPCLAVSYHVAPVKDFYRVF